MHQHRAGRPAAAPVAGPAVQADTRKGVQLRGLSFDAQCAALDPGRAPAVQRKEASAAPKDAPPAQDDQQTEFDLGQQLYNAGDAAKAVDHYLKAYESGRSHRGIIAFNIGQCYRRLGRDAEAVGWYEKALAGGDAAQLKGEIEEHIAKCRGGAAVKDAIAKPATEHDRIEKVFDAAQKAFNAGNWDAAIKGYLEVWNRGPATTRGVAAFNLGQAYRKLGSLVDAAVYYQLALDIGVAGGHQYDGEIREHLAKIQAGSDQAIADSQAKGKGQGGKPPGNGKPKKDGVPKDALACFAQAQDLYSQKYYDAAVDAYADVFAMPGLPAKAKGIVAYNMGQSYRMLNQPAPAIRWYQSALTYDSARPFRSEIEEHLQKLGEKLSPQKSQEAGEVRGGGPAPV